MEILDFLGITPETYDFLFLEAGCHFAEVRYSKEFAQAVKTSSHFWKWLRIQQQIIDADFMARWNSLTDKKRIYMLYFKCLYTGFEKVYPPASFDKMIKLKEYGNTQK